MGAGHAVGAAAGQRAAQPLVEEARRIAALQKVTAKIERNQRDDGSFAGNNGWAAVLEPPGWTPEKTARLRPLLRASDT